MNWEVRVADRARKKLRRLPGEDRARILAALQALSENPYFRNAEKMESEDRAWRRRVGAYRIFYELSSKEGVVFVFRIERRTSKTYRKR